LPGGSRAQREPPDEYEIKAAMLRKFLPFIEWPAAIFADQQTKFRVGVLGKDPFGAKLDKAFAGEELGRTLEVRRFAGWQQLEQKQALDGCHMLFVASSERDHLVKILEHLAGKPCLIVTEGEGVAEVGCHLSFLIKEGKVRFEANPEAAKAAGLGIRAQLLRLALVVQWRKKSKQ
jgi:hypothetical protein